MKLNIIPRKPFLRHVKRELNNSIAFQSISLAAKFVNTEGINRSG